MWRRISVVGLCLFRQAAFRPERTIRVFIPGAHPMGDPDPWNIIPEPARRLTCHP